MIPFQKQILQNVLRIFSDEILQFFRNVRIRHHIIKMRVFKVLFDSKIVNFQPMLLRYVSIREILRSRILFSENAANVLKSGPTSGAVQG